MKLLLASANLHKHEEFQEYFGTISHSFSIYRDLHCWELSMNWTPNGIGQGINFKLNVKSPTLRDLKIEKKGGIYSGAGL